ncbi:MAG: TetR/AcrR family transcriptional regulator [Bacteroidota bacterium]
MKTRSRNARGQGKQLRSELIEAAIRLLVELGNEKPFSMRALAKEANVSAPSVYLHFADKTQLFLAVLEKLVEEQIEIRRNAELAAGENSWDKLLAGELAYAKFALERSGHYMLLYDGRLLRNLDDPKSAAFGKPILHRNTQLIQDIIVKYPTPRVTDDPLQLALLLWSGIHGIVSLIINKPTIEWPDASVLVKQMALSIIHPYEPE